MADNYFILILLIVIVFIKAAADGYNYKYNTAENEKDKTFYGIVYHIFGLLLIAHCLLFVFFGLNITNFFILVSGFALIYFGIFDAIYNRITGRPLLYIGKTDIIDMFLSRVFAKPFLKWVLFCIRWLCLGIGMYLIIDVLKF